MSVKSLRAAIATELARVTALEQPTERARESQRLQVAAQSLSEGAAEITRGAVRDMRELFGHSWQDVADELHVSRARAQQIGNA